MHAGIAGQQVYWPKAQCNHPIHAHEFNSSIYWMRLNHGFYDLNYVHKLIFTILQLIWKKTKVRAFHIIEVKIA